MLSSLQIDHLLDFSKINYYAQSPRTSKGNDVRKASSGKRSASFGSTMSLEGDVPLDVVTEEVVQTTVYGFQSIKSATRGEDAKIDIILDIGES